MNTARLLVIGGASLDTIHLTGHSFESAGGTGVYAALAATRCGVEASLLGPRPDPMPAVLAPVAGRLSTWLGPSVRPEALPHFQIVHQGGGSSYLEALYGAEQDLTPASLPPDLSIYDCVHIVSLGDVQRQRAFLRACRRRGAKRISVGTNLNAVVRQQERVRAVMDQADISFMNEREAVGLFGSIRAAKIRPGSFLFITQGERGVSVIQGDFSTRVPGSPAKPIDLTGAGSTFCGATLARLIGGEHPIIAARLAMPLVAEMTEHVGPEALLRPGAPLPMPLDHRVVVNQAQVERLAPLVAGLGEVSPFPFTGPNYPPAGHPATVAFFFAATLQQFSFWTPAQGRYDQPLIAPLDGEQLKGSDYLWRSFVRRLDSDPEFYSPQRQANLTRQELLSLFRADDGSNPMPAVDLHLAQAQRYGRDMLALGLAPEEVVRQAQASPSPLDAFVRMLDHVGGYKEDPLRKKTALLAMILNQRPEKFLVFGPDERLAPVIDYHLMRATLRTGLIDVADSDLRQDLADRRLLSPEDEWVVRSAAYRAIEQVAALSGRDSGAVDNWLFFNSRNRCPEMTEPECEACPLDPLCAHRKELFQPVIRTTFY